MVIAGTGEVGDTMTSTRSSASSKPSQMSRRMRWDWLYIPPDTVSAWICVDSMLGL